MALNLYNLELQLAQKMQYAATDEELLFYSKTMELIRNNSITVVSNFAALPAITVAIAGELYFVQSDELLYIPVISSGQWQSLIPFYLSRMWTWGRNSYGQLGDNTAVNKSSPILVAGGFSDWCQVSAGFRHTVAVRIDGTAWSWGRGSYGVLGDGTVTYKSSPGLVVGGFSDWCQVSAGRYHTVAVRTNCTAWSWGIGGRLGDGTGTSRLSPVLVVGGFSDWRQVSAGSQHSAAVRTNGTAWAWGSAFHGQLGNGCATDQTSPVSVVGGFTDWCQISAGCYHTAAVRTTGSLWAWGRNGNGQLGDGTTTGRTSPVSVVGGFTDWCQVSAGGYHNAAVRTNGTAWAWGDNGAGRLGDITLVAKSSPVSVVGGFTDWCQVSASLGHTMAVRTNGTVWSWGCNNCGQLGDNTTVNKSSPGSIVGGIGEWCQVSAGQCHTVAVRTRTF